MTNRQQRVYDALAEFGARIRLIGNRCQVHGYHWPPPRRTVVHHIWPQGAGGPDVAANRVLVCDTGHYNIHQLLDRLLKGQSVLGNGTRAEIRYARQGYASIQAHAITQIGE